MDCWEVWEERAYIVGAAGAPCTAEMKKKPRISFQLPGDIQAFGYTTDERDRATRFTDNNLELESTNFTQREWQG